MPVSPQMLKSITGRACTFKQRGYTVTVDVDRKV